MVLLGRVVARETPGIDLRKLQGSFTPRGKVGGAFGWSADLVWAPNRPQLWLGGFPVGPKA